MLRSVRVRAPRTRILEDAVIIPVFSGARTLPPAAARADRTLEGMAAALFADAFAGRRGETRTACVRRARRLLRVVLVGLGPRAARTPEALADAAGAAARALRGRVASAALLLDDAVEAATSAEADAILHALLKGFALASYSVSGQPGDTPTVRRLVVVTSRSQRSLAPVIRRARLVCDLIVRVRDWVNAPANRLTPSAFAEASRELCVASGVMCRVWNRKEIEKARMGAVLAVAVGSREEPRFLVMQYNMERPDLPLVCLAGKGVTFDSGGISIKPWEKMHEMKGDMAGGAAVVAAMAACASMKLPMRVVGLVPCVENMLGGGSLRPGDVVETCTGKTIEILTTDAEGRLILADAVAYAHAHYKPDVIVDIATLTGSVLIALGTRIAGIVGTSARHARALEEAGRRSGEPVWTLPLDEYFSAMIKGDISDYKNYGGRNASAITAGAMIGVFAQSTPWVHVDIAGTAWNDGGGPAYQTPGATGYGVDLLLRFLEGLAGAS